MSLVKSWMSRTVAVVLAIAVVLSGAIQATPAWAVPVTAGTPTLSGETPVGSTLTINEGEWTPAETTFTYVWRRNGTPIADATSGTYVTVTDDIGATITATVTGSAETFDSTSVLTSNSVQPQGVFSTTSVPTITGRARIGGVLTADPGTWVPAPEYGFGFAWKRDGIAIPDADVSTYTLTADDMGTDITVTATAVHSNYPWTSETSLPFAIPRLFLASPSPTIIGTTIFGSTLTANVSGWNPSVGVSYSYQWKRTVNAVTTDIDLATSNTYELTESDIGATISVTVDGVKTGFASAATSGNTAAISTATFATTTVPIITGTTTVDSTLTASVSGWSPTPDAPYTYQWHRTIDTVTTDIFEATDPTYVLTADDLNATISVTVEGTKTGYTPVSTTSAKTTSITRTNFITTTVPTITGTTTIDSTLTANVSGWSPTPDGEFTYQWHRTFNSVTTDISDATDATYVLDTADFGKTISVSVQGIKAGYNTVTRTSVQTTAIAATIFATTTDPTITGDTVFGLTLTAEVTGWTPSEDVSYTYQWRRTVDTDTTDISTARARQYVLTTDDIGATISVTVEGTKTGYTPVSATSAETEAITAATFSYTYDPQILGETAFGSTLTAHVPYWSPSSGVSYTYQWRRTVDTDTTDISTARARQYVLTTDDIGATISVTVEGTKTGYTPVSATSAETEAITTAEFVATTIPTITGNTVFGSILSANVSGWSPTPNAPYSYQWHRTFESVTTDIGDNEASYELTVDDINATISVTVEGTKTGYTPTSTTSSETAAITKATFATATLPTISGITKVASLLTASVTGWDPAPDEEYIYQWHRHVGLITTDIGDNEASYELTPDDFNATISVTVQGSKAGYTAVSRTSAKTSAITAASFDVVGTPSISGTLAIDDVLTVDPGAWTPEPESYRYQWRRGGVPIAAATEETYTLTAEDMGTDITVRVTPILDGYNQTVATSDVTSIPFMDFDTSGLPTIDGTPDLDSTLTALSDVFAPTPDSLTYQWYRNGVAIVDETEDSYTVAVEDSLAEITVEVTATSLGFNDLTLTSEPVTASEVLRYSVSPRPSIAGIPQVGKTLVASSTEWTPAPDSFDYQWLRNGVVINEATSEEYELVGDDVGRTISVRITPNLTNYIPIVRVSQPTSTVLSGVYTVKPIPTISGVTAVGQLLTANTSGWTPTPTSFTYTWLRNGTAISDAPASTYRLTAADRGFVISVRVTPVLTGYSSTSKTSDATGAVATGTFTSTSSPTISGTVAVGQTLTAATTAWSPAAAITYQWKRGTTVISGATSAQYQVDPADAGSILTVTALGTADGITSASTTSLPTISVPALSFSGGANAVIVGDSSVGATLSVTFGTLTPTPTTIAYQWKREGVDIGGATSATYVPTSDDQWLDITVTVTASKPGYDAWTRTTAIPVTVSAGVIGSLTRPRIAGTTRVGSTLRATTGTWTNSPDTFDYQWYRDGELLEDETENTYVLTEEDLGFTFVVGVTAFKDGFVDESAFSLPTEEVRLAKFNAQPIPTITGTAKVASTLTAVTGSWSPTPTGFAYQWTRTGVPITGANSATYVLTSADVDARIRVIVSGVRDNFEAEPKTSEPTAAVASGTFIATPVPTVAGVAKVGELLTATVPAWTPTVDSTTYQWKRNGQAIQSATSLTYRVAPADLNALLTFSTTGIKAGFVTAISTSATTTPIIPAVFGTKPVPTISGIAAVGELLTVRPGTWLPTPDLLSYQWRRDEVPITGATSPTYVLQPADAGKVMSVVVTATRTAYTAASQTSTPTDEVAALVFDDAVKPTLDGVEVVGNTLRVSPGDWIPAPTRFEYQWLRDSEPIDGSNSATYTLVGDDAESTISAEVTGIKLGYETTTMTSDKTDAIELGTLTATPVPVITGTARVGNQLTVSAGTWQPRPVDLEYQWMSDGEDIEDATETRYTPTADDLGAAISVRVEASKLGYVSETMTSVDTADVVEGILTATPVPTISGTVQVGNTLTARPGTWRPTDVELSYQWLRGTSNVGGNSSTYALTAADAGSTISVRVTGSLEAYTTVIKTSIPTAAVALGAFTAAPAPSVSGDYKVGKTLTATAGTWTPTATLTYKWFRGNKAIIGETNPTYVLTTSDYGKTVSAAVVATLDGYAVTTRTSTPTLVNLGVFDTSPTPTITGTARVGSTLTAVAGSWSPTATLSYRWNRNGTPINGATTSTYAVVGADLGATLSVTVTGSSAAYTPTPKTSTNTAAVTSTDFTTSPTPTISGIARVGSVLTATPGSWLPAPSSLGYQWFRKTGALDPAPIALATKSTYTLVAADLGSEISVKVTATLLGYNTLQKASLATGEIDTGTFSPAPAPTISGTERVGMTLTATAGTWGPVTPTLAYQWKREGVSIGSAESRTYELTEADLGTNITVEVSATAPGFSSTTVTSNATGYIALGVLNPAPTPTIAGTIGVGNTVTATPGTWGPGSVSFAYRWKLNGNAITDATLATYSIGSADFGGNITVEVTATRAGYTTVVKTSAARVVIAGTFSNSVLPAISGTATVGSVLTATQGTWSPTPDSATYQWLRGGVAIRGATNSTYILVTKDRGKKISVRVTVMKTNYTTTSKASAVVQIS